MKSRALPLLAIATVALLAWAWFVQMGRSMSMQGAMPGMHMGAVALALMWAVMMAAMMAPAAAPSFLLHARLSNSPIRASAYLVGYLGAWSAIGVVYALAQWFLQRAGMLDMQMRLHSAPVAGALLVAAGAWQWSAIKAGCVARCRSPMGFMMNDWRDGTIGAFTMGVRYAGWCVGCCWLVMAVLFVAGTMSFAWALAISLYVLAERLLPLGRAFDRAVGAAMIASGTWMIVTASA